MKNSVVNISPEELKGLKRELENTLEAYKEQFEKLDATAKSLVQKGGFQGAPAQEYLNVIASKLEPEFDKIYRAMEKAIDTMEKGITGYYKLEADLYDVVK